MHKDIDNSYFEWLYDLVCRERYAKDISYRKLLMYLRGTEFVYSIAMDKNRAHDGLDLRYRYSMENRREDLSDYISGNCSVLEMMIALAIRCEENIMDDTLYGDRTTQWFWGMINNLGLSSMTDSSFDKVYVEETVSRFLNRDYEPDGKGGLFTIKNSSRDIRDIEIWQQLCWYLDCIV